MGRSMFRIVRVLSFVILLAGCIKHYIPDLTARSIEGALTSGVPPGWVFTGTSLDDYNLDYDTTFFRNGSRSISLLSTSALPGKFASLQQSIEASAYAGKRVRFSAYVRANRVRKWAGIWMRADTPTLQSAAFDDMFDRKIEGSLDWHRYQIVLDIPPEADYICYGIALHGTGQVWIDDCALEIVGGSVETTGTWRPSSEHQSSRDPFFQDDPFNMDFEIIEN
jgi:hypothetical protein